MIFTLPNLPYSYDALVPYIDAPTMQLHHTKHHQTYINNLNQAITATSIASAQGTEISVLTHLLKNINSYHAPVRNNAGGHFNHLFFWDTLIPNGSQRLQPVLLDALDQSFGGFEPFQKAFTAAAAAHFGSGWVWLSVSQKDQKLFISTTDYQDNPLMNSLPLQKQGVPILGLDLWEHAYYLLYQNRRLEYIEAFWQIIHWSIVQERFIHAIK